MPKLPSSDQKPVGLAQQRLLDRLAEMDVGLSYASMKWLNRNSAYIHQYIFRGSPRFLPEIERKTLAERTGLSEADLGMPKATPEFASQPSVTSAANIPEIDVRAGAGGGGVTLEVWTADHNGNTFAADDVRAVWGIPSRFLREELQVKPDAVRIVEVMGDSMTPTLRPGDRVFVDTNHKTPSPPGVYVVWDGFGVVVKRVELVPRTDPPRVLLISDNSSHRQYELTLEEAHIVGRVIGKISLM